MNAYAQNRQRLQNQKFERVGGKEIRKMDQRKFDRNRERMRNQRFDRVGGKEIQKLDAAAAWRRNKQRMQNQKFERVGGKEIRKMDQNKFDENRRRLAEAQALRMRKKALPTFEVIDERVAWATDISKLPRDPRLVYGGTIIRHRDFEEQAYIAVMPSVMAPILKKREETQAELLKKILQQVGQRGDAPMSGLQGQAVRQPPHAMVAR
jgi:hypothetical protein